MDEFVSVTEAARLLGVSRHTIGRVVAAGRLPVYEAELDRRRRLLRRAEVERLVEPQPVEPPPVEKRRRVVQVAPGEWAIQDDTENRLIGPYYSRELADEELCAPCSPEMGTLAVQR